MRLAPGLALDLTCNDPEDGLPWDFNYPNKVANARRIIQDGKPLLSIGSPMRAALSQLQHIQHATMNK